MSNKTYILIACGIVVISVSVIISAVIISNTSKKIETTAEVAHKIEVQKEKQTIETLQTNNSTTKQQKIIEQPTETPAPIVETKTEEPASSVVTYEDKLFGRLSFDYDASVWDFVKQNIYDNNEEIVFSNKKGTSFKVIYGKYDIGMLSGNMSRECSKEIVELKPAEKVTNSVLDDSIVKSGGLARLKLSEGNMQMISQKSEYLYGVVYSIKSSENENCIYNYGSVGITIPATAQGIPSGDRYMATVVIPSGQNLSESDLREVDEIVKTMSIK